MPKNALAAVETPEDTAEPETPEQARARYRRELDAAVVTLEFKGLDGKKQTATLPKRRGRWTTDAGEAFEDEKFLTALRELVGPAAWAAIKVAHPLLDDLNKFADYAGGKIRAECVD